MTTGAGPGRRGDFLRARLAELYPAPLRVVMPGDPGGGGGSASRYLALPSARTVRVLVPARPRSASARSVRLQLSGSRLRTRSMRAAMSVAARSGVLSLVRGVPVAVVGSGESIETVLRRELGVGELLVTMPVGPQRATRKSVLQVTDLGGRPLAYVKVGHDPLTRRLVRHEAEVLATLDRSSWTTLIAPQLLARLEWRELSLLVMSPLAMPRRLREGPRARSALVSVIAQIARSSQGDVGSEDGGRALRLRLAAVLQGLEAPAVTDLRVELDLLTAQATPVPLGCWHGDLNPGNLVVGTDQVPVWDWERFEAGVPLGLDLLHHGLMTAITVRGRPPLPAAEELLCSAPGVLGALGVEHGPARASARLYLLLLAARYLGDKQVEAGASLGRVEEWLVPALQRTRTEDDR